MKKYAIIYILSIIIQCTMLDVEAWQKLDDNSKTTVVSLTLIPGVNTVGAAMTLGFMLNKLIHGKEIL